MENLTAEQLKALNDELENKLTQKGEQDEAIKKLQEENAKFKADLEEQKKLNEQLNRAIAINAMLGKNNEKKTEKEPDGYLFPGLKLGAYYNENK